MPADVGRVTHLPVNKGRSFAHLGTAITFKDEPTANGDAVLLFEMRMPSGHGVPPHTERNHEVILRDRRRARDRSRRESLQAFFGRLS